MRTIAIVNQKGGCGKTTTAINLAGVLAHFGERTLLVDLDPQSHCAAGLAIPEDRLDLHIGDAMLAPARAPIDEARLLWRIRKNLDLAPSSMRLAALEAARGGLADAEDRDERLARVLGRWSDRYDLCLVDCPPSIGLLTYNALRAADDVLIPVETGFFAMQGAGRQISTIRALAKRLGGATPYRLLVTMHDENSSLANELLAELKRRFGDRVAPAIIRLDRKLKDATSMGQPVVEYAPTSVGAQDYSDLAAWLLGRPAPVTNFEPALPAPFPRTTPAIEPKPFSRLAADSDAPSGGPIAAAPINVVPAPTHATAQPQEDPILSRAAELAIRARQLLQRGNQLQQRLRNDPDVQRLEARAQAGPDVVTTASTVSPKQPHAGPVEAPGGVIFRHHCDPRARVAVAGEFNRWSPGSTPLRYNPATGLHEGRATLPPGRCEYRLVVDGVWIADPGNPSTTVNPFGETNSVVVVAGPPAHALTEGAD